MRLPNQQKFEQNQPQTGSIPLFKLSMVGGLLTLTHTIDKKQKNKKYLHKSRFPRAIDGINWQEHKPSCRIK